MRRGVIPEGLDLGERCIAHRRGRHSGIQACLFPPGQQSGGEGTVGIRTLTPEARCGDQILIHHDVIEVAEPILQMLECRYEFSPALRRSLASVLRCPLLTKRGRGAGVTIRARQSPKSFGSEQKKDREDREKYNPG